MFVQELRREFYDKILGKHVLVIANQDVDSVCACKILQSLLRCDNISYTFVPVQGVRDLQKACSEHMGLVKHMILINCGGTLDLVELLEPAEDVTFYVADNHRPTDVCNVYSDGQVKLMMKPTEEEGIPSFEHIFQEESDEEENSDEESEEGGGQKRRRLDVAAIEKRREKRLWEEKRQKILFEYTQFSSYGQPTSMLMFDFAWKLSRDSPDLLWWATIGLTEQLLLGHAEDQRYILWAGTLQGHATRLANLTGMSRNLAGGDSLRVSFEKELQLAMYRHWSLEASMRHSLLVACRFKLWTLRGEKRMLEFLAELGLPLSQCRQQYNVMESDLRSELLESVEAQSKRFQLDNLIFGSFHAQFGFRHRFSASDAVYATLALLESSEKNRLPSECFMDALDCLSRSRVDILLSGIDRAKKLLLAAFKHMHDFLAAGQVVSAGPFLYAVIQEGRVDSHFFSRPHCLTLLARYTLRAHVASSRSRRASQLPLVLTAPCSPHLATLQTSDTQLSGTQRRDGGLCLVVGVPPIMEEKEAARNLFGQAFAQAAERTGATVDPDCFDASVIQLKTEDRSRFFDALISLLS